MVIFINCSGLNESGFVDIGENTRYIVIVPQLTDKQMLMRQELAAIFGGSRS